MIYKIYISGFNSDSYDGRFDPCHDLPCDIELPCLLTRYLICFNLCCKLKGILTWHHQSIAYSQSLRHNVSHHMQVSQCELCFHQCVRPWVDINRILAPVFSFLLFGPWECNLVKFQLQFHFHKMLQNDLLKIFIKNLR